jgi:hypothetical protein
MNATMVTDISYISFTGKDETFTGAMFMFI